MKTYKKSTKSKISFVLFGIIIICLILIALEITVVTHVFNRQNNEIANTTSTQPSAQNDFSNGSDRIVIQTKKDEGTVTDTKGSITTVPPNSEWSTSTDNIISVYLPAKKSIISNGQILSGEANSDNVSFRLVDNVSGMIAQGKIITVNNKFSGVFNFNTIASEGRLDVFITDEDGVESSVVEIPVGFAQ